MSGAYDTPKDIEETTKEVTWRRGKPIKPGKKSKKKSEKKKSEQNKDLDPLETQVIHLLMRRLCLNITIFWFNIGVHNKSKFIEW